LSWQPSFCESHSSKPECAAETDASYEATHLTLHGLWPQPRSRDYCNVEVALVSADRKSDWASLPAVDLGPDTRARLDKVMPGTRSMLERHEWIRHGTCYNGLDKEAYFKQALALADEVDASAVQALLAGRIGQEVKATEIRAAFDTAFGAGTGDRVRIACRKDGSRQLIAELTIGLDGPDGKLADRTKAAKATDPGCQGGIVDPTGLQ
jgi:ribonuclease T2